MTETEALDRLHEIMDGCDRSDGDDVAWWETVTGARFGAERLAELESLISELAG